MQLGRNGQFFSGLALPLSPCSFPNLPHVPDTNTETDPSRPDFLRDIHHFLKQPAASADERRERHIWHSIFDKLFLLFWRENAQNTVSDAEIEFTFNFFL